MQSKCHKFNIKIFIVRVICIFITLNSSKSFHATKGKPYGRNSKLRFTVNDINPLYVAFGCTAIVSLLKLGGYYKLQVVKANMIGSIPKSSRVLEIDAEDGKNVFYLPQGTDYTAVMSPGDDPSKEKEKMRVNEQLILECIGKANVEGLGLSGRVRTRSQEIPAKSVDCVITTGSLVRSAAPVELVQEGYRLLRPGGLLVFVEPDSREDIVEIVAKVFPERIQGGVLAGEKNKAAEREEKSMKKEKRRRKKKKDSVQQMSYQSVSSTTSTAESDLVDVERKQIEDSAGGETVESESSETKERPGIIFERERNWLDPYVAGIAVRP